MTGDGVGGATCAEGSPPSGAGGEPPTWCVAEEQSADDEARLALDAEDDPTGTQAVVALTFQPWHRPRKQYVRRRQWEKHIDALFEQLGKGGVPRTVSYLTLPGDELLDVRLVHQVCRRRNWQLQYLGFNCPSGGATSELTFAEADVSKLEGVNTVTSRVIRSRLECVCGSGTPEHNALRELAPYDVVNIDLCDSIARLEPGAKNSALDALAQVIRVQRQKRLEPWLLLLTTRNDGTHPKTWERLCKAVKDNISQSEEFASQLPDGTQSRPEAWPDDASFRASGFTIAFGKWLLALLWEGQPRGEVHLESVLHYGVFAASDMSSISLRISPVVTEGTDRAGLVASAGPRPAKTEAELGVRLAKRAIKGRNVDEILSESADLWNEMAREVAEDVGLVRFPRAGYLEWARRDRQGLALKLGLSSRA